jgi:hypothetical protein
MHTFDSISAALRSMAMLQFGITLEIVSLEGCTSRQRKPSRRNELGEDSRWNVLKGSEPTTL